MLKEFRLRAQAEGVRRGWGGGMCPFVSHQALRALLSRWIPVIGVHQAVQRNSGRGWVGTREGPHTPARQPRCAMPRPLHRFVSLLSSRQRSLRFKYKPPYTRSWQGPFRTFLRRNPQGTALLSYPFTDAFLMPDEPHRLVRATYLQLLGVADKDIAADYALTTIGLQPAFPLLAARFQKDNVFRDNWKGTLSLGSAKCVHVSLSSAPSLAQVAQAHASSLSLLQTRDDAGDAGCDRERVRERGRIREAAHVAHG